MQEANMVAAAHSESPETKKLPAIGRHERVLIKIFQPGNKKCELLKRKAPRGHGWTDDQIDETLMLIAGDLEKQHPGEDFECVKLGEARYNIVHRAKTDERFRRRDAVPVSEQASGEVVDEHSHLHAG